MQDALTSTTLSSSSYRAVVFQTGTGGVSIYKQDQTRDEFLAWRNF
jgi:hypothetical protein